MGSCCVATTPAFKRVVDAATAKVYKSGEIDKIYARWFQKPDSAEGS